MAKAKTSKLKAARSKYESAKRLYKRVGKDTSYGRDVPARSQKLSDYVAVKREYRQAGKALAKLTGKKPRR